MLFIIGIIIFLFIVCFIAFIKKSKSSNKTNTYNSSENKLPAEDYPYVNMDNPILTKHAAMRMQERLGIYGSNQTELINHAFKYGRTADRTSGDLRRTLEEKEMRSEQKYGEKSIAKFYNNSIFIFTDEDNKLKTVYKYNSNIDRYYWN